jgi:MFS family permease
MPARTQRAIAPLATVYVTFGMFWGCIAIVWGTFLAAEELSAGRAGLYLTLTSATGIFTMTLVAPRLEHLPRHVTIPAALASHASGAFLLAWLPPELLPLAFFAIGCGTGLVDVLVNAVGHESEVRTGRAVLQWVHMSYSLGGAAGAIAAGLLLTAGATFRTALVVMGIAQLVAGGIVIFSTALRAVPERERSETKVSLAAFRRMPFLLVPALVVCSAFFVEGSMDVWSGAFLQDTLGASALGGAVGFSAFALATALGRALAAKILFGMGYRTTTIVSGAGSVAAAAVAVTAPSVAVAAGAFLVLGFCISAAAPSAFGSVEGGSGTQAGVAIAAVTTAGYAGFVVGPPFMGWLVDATGNFRVTMLVLCVSSLGILAGGLMMRRGR